MKIINYTPHEIKIKNAETGEFNSISPSGIVCRVSTKSEKTGSVNGIEIFNTVFGEVENPPEKDGNIYIVSAICKAELKNQGHCNVFSPSQLIRDGGGNVIGCAGLDA